MEKVFDPSKFISDRHGADELRSKLLNLNDDADDAGIDFLFTSRKEKFIARGNIQVVKGREKTGKSAFGIALIASALGGGFLGIEPTIDDLNVLWIDTEQEKATLRERAKAALFMASTDTDCDRLSVLPLNGEVPEERLTLTAKAIRELRPDFVFMDGAVDLCEDSNDNKESRKVVEELMKVAAECKCAILCVIHTNKKDDEARGHLGTILQQKCSETYVVSKGKTGVATVEQSLSRFASVQPISFRFGDNFTLASTDGEPTEGDNRKSELSDLFADIFDGGDKIRKCDLINKLILSNGCGRTTAKKAIEDAERLKVIIREGDGKSVYYSYFTDEFPDASKDEDEGYAHTPWVDDSDI